MWEENEHSRPTSFIQILFKTISKELQNYVKTYNEDGGVEFSIQWEKLQNKCIIETWDGVGWKGP